MTCRQSLVLLLFPLALCQAEWALVNIVRHAERADNKTANDGGLHPYGKKRAEYIAKCVSDPTPTLAFPLGPPNKILCSTRGENAATSARTSTRPRDTIAPLAEKLGRDIDSGIDFEDIPKFLEYVNKLPHGQTLLVAWQHKLIAQLAASLDPYGTESGVSPQMFPDKCLYDEWTEPDEIQDGACYDIVWQLMLYRPDKDAKFETQGFTHLHMGFGGSPDSPCAAAFRPHSSPVTWEFDTEEHHKEDHEHRRRRKHHKHHHHEEAEEEVQLATAPSTSVSSTTMLLLTAAAIFGSACTIAIQNLPWKHMVKSAAGADASTPLLLEIE